MDGSKYSAVIANLPADSVPNTSVLGFDACRENDSDHSSNVFKEKLIQHGYTGIITVHTGIWSHNDFGQIIKWVECRGHNAILWAS